MATRTPSYRSLRKMIGKRITDGVETYQVTDYSIAQEMYKCWCKTRQRYFWFGPNTIGTLFQVITG